MKKRKWSKRNWSKKLSRKSRKESKNEKRKSPRSLTRLRGVTRTRPKICWRFTSFNKILKSRASWSGKNRWTRFTNACWIRRKEKKKSWRRSRPSSSRRKKKATGKKLTQLNDNEDMKRFLRVPFKSFRRIRFLKQSSWSCNLATEPNSESLSSSRMNAIMQSRKQSILCNKSTLRYFRRCIRITWPQSSLSFRTLTSTIPRWRLSEATLWRLRKGKDRRWSPGFMPKRKLKLLSESWIRNKLKNALRCERNSCVNWLISLEPTFPTCRNPWKLRFWLV
eukprot:09345_5